MTMTSSDILFESDDDSDEYDEGNSLQEEVMIQDQVPNPIENIDRKYIAIPEDMNDSLPLNLRHVR